MSAKNIQTRRPGRPSLDDSKSALGNLYKVAFSHFIANGLDGANIQLIAKEAGVSRQMIHNRFGDKEAFFTKVNQFAQSYLRKKFNFKLFADYHNPWAAFEEIAEQMLDIFMASETIEVFRMMNLAVYKNPEIGKWHTKSLNKAYHGFQLILKKSASEMGLDLYIDQSAARDFIALVFGYAQPVIQGRASRPSKTRQAKEVKLLVSRYLRGLGFGDPQ